jgi:Domain of unknown function (DUF1877)
MSTYCTLSLEVPANGNSYAADETVALERRWELLNHLLAGTNEPIQIGVAGFLVADFVELSPEVHLIDASQVAEINSWLSDFKDSDLLQRFDPEAMERESVYDADLAKADAQAYSDALLRDLSVLRTFIAHAAKLGSNVVRVIC